MAGRTYKDNMSTLVKYFCVRNFPDAARDAYNRELSHLPVEAMDWIVESIVRDRRPTSGNFPTIREIKDTWYEWQRQNPNKVIKPNQTVKPCGSCGGTGFLLFKGPMPCIENDAGQLRYYDKPPQLVAWCEDCENWKRHANNIDGERRYTKRYILDQGWELWPYGNQKPRKNLKDMISNVGMHIESEPKDFSDLRWNDRRVELAKQAAALITNAPTEEVPF